MRSITDEIIAALEEFTLKLEKGEPIEATQVEKVDTPDGPMHIRKKVILTHDNDLPRD